MNKRKIAALVLITVLMSNFCLADESASSLPPNLILEPCYSFKIKKKSKHVSTEVKPPVKLQYQPVVEESSVVKEEAREIERTNGSEYKPGMDSVINPKPSNTVKDEEIIEGVEHEPSQPQHCSCAHQ